MTVKRLIWISLAVLILVTLSAVVAYRALERADAEFKESKWVRTTSGTVLRKELFVCHEPTCSYLGYGKCAEMKQGESQQRLYYEIDNFDQVNPARRAKALEVEKRLVGLCGPRSTDALRWFDRVQPGSKIQVHYQCFSDGQIEIVGVDFEAGSPKP